MDGDEYVVFANPSRETFVAFLPEDENGRRINLSLSAEDFPAAFDDDAGGTWDIFGACIAGPCTGDQLRRPHQMIGFWFAVSSMFAEVTLIDEPTFRETIPEEPRNDWLVNTNFVQVGAPKDGIPAIREPRYDVLKISENPFVDFLQDFERVAVIKRGDSTIVFPMPVMDWHEVVNVTEDQQLIYSYCPLTGTSLLNQAPSSISNFGVSGFLYNNNLIMYDQTTESYWSQMQSRALTGDFKGSQLSNGHVIEMNWGAARLLDETIYLLNPGNSFGRNYNIYPYGDYETNNNDIFFALSFTDDRLPAKERVLAIPGEKGTLVVRRSDLF
jgi:hypothetical protein